MENVTYQQLTLLPKDELTAPQQAFLAVHNEMLMASQKAAECLLIVATDMKKMRDEELYRAAGFDSFREYVETALNIKERQAYNWISILNLPAEYLTQNAQMGVTKLALIASASGEVADKLMEDDGTPEKSVRELAATIKEQEKAIEDKTQQIIMLTEALGAEKKKNMSLSEADIAEYERKIKDLENKLQEANDGIQIAADKLANKEAAIEKLKKQKAKVVEKTVEKTVDNPETQKALEMAQAEAEKAKAEKAKAEELARKATEALATHRQAQEAVAIFKVCAENLFGIWDDVLRAFNSIKETDAKLAGKCKSKLAEFIACAQKDLEEQK